MKSIIFFMSFFCASMTCLAQKQLISYEDMKYLIENNLSKADTFLLAKGYTALEVNKKTNNRKYGAQLPGGTESEVDLRADGKRIYMDIFTDEISQYNMIHNSIAQFLVKDQSMGDVEAYNIKHLGDIYITVTDKVPYNPIRKNIEIHLVARKDITARD